MPMPPPAPPPLAQPLRQRLSQSSLRAFASGTANAVGSSIRTRRLSTSTPLLKGTPFLHRRPWFPLSPRTSRLYSTSSGGPNTQTSGGVGSDNGSSGSSGSSGGSDKGSKRTGFGQRLRQALSKTKLEWYPIPIGLGISFLAYSQLRKASTVEETGNNVGVEEETTRKKKKTIRPDGPWQVQVLSTLPLKAFSRAWGWFNERTLPVFLRAPGFKLYSYLFGVNLDEIKNPDLTSYRNLSEFFYRELKSEVRPIDLHPNSLISPADGTVLHFGEVRPGGHVEQVKGMTYSLDALIGAKTIGAEFPTSPASSTPSSSGASTPRELTEGGVLDPDEEFAILNGIHYTLPALLHGTTIETERSFSKPKSGSELVQELTQTRSEYPPEDASVPDGVTTPDVVEVAKELISGTTWHTLHSDAPTKLFFCVIYLAPGDYHHFHSPVSWVVHLRRHFAGELFSVSPFLQRTLPNLFTLNERVALLGRWKHGLFTMTPVGATNVGSIVVNFDKDLRTNNISSRPLKEGGCSEASYSNASKILQGVPVRKGSDMGGFKLGSTIVLVFEAPGSKEGEAKGFQWACKRGGKVKVGESLGFVAE